MSAILKYISRISLILLVLVSATSCTRWHEAKEVIAEADSLLANKVVTRDTMALATAIDALNNTIGHIFAREELAKAYYFMGRNYYYLNDFSTAADYYILCDRMNPKDPIYKGRINSCMGYLCKQDSCFAEALEFYERANVAFKESGNDRRYANGLLNIAEQYINLKEYTKADSILHLAAEYEIDSVYYANLIDVKALAFYNQELYDSALVCLLEIKDYPRNIDAKCFSYLKLVQTYAHLDSLEQTLPFANYILYNSNNAIFRSNVYFYLIQYAEKKNLVANLAKYSYCREDEDRRVRHNSELYAQAFIKLKAYLDDPYPNKRIAYLIFAIGILFFGVLGMAIGLFKRYHRTVQKQKKQKANRSEAFAKRVYNHSIYFMDPKIWDNNKDLRKLANTHMGDIFTRLEDTYRLNEREIKICLMILLEYSREQIAHILLVQPNTISKTKNKIAKDLNTTSAQLRDFLIDFLSF